MGPGMFVCSRWEIQTSSRNRARIGGLRIEVDAATVKGSNGLIERGKVRTRRYDCVKFRRGLLRPHGSCC
jgi:hypothetical protein